MAPKTVFVMRHAEKSGDPMDPHLTAAGYKRAAALALWLPEISKIDCLFATTASKHSNRPFETIKPLADKTHITINSDFSD
ncbi:MAG: histidine phosphatase family protein, partial [Rhizobiaceae bacterium]|nr:histidine phosphatase family protein [Rhizobiaceae bacterium]